MGCTACIIGAGSIGCTIEAWTALVWGIASGRCSTMLRVIPPRDSGIMMLRNCSIDGVSSNMRMVCADAAPLIRMRPLNAAVASRDERVREN